MEIGGPHSSTVGAYQQQMRNNQPKLKVNKILIHPGEINSFKSWPCNKRIIASHSDLHDLFLWDINLQTCAQSKIRQEQNVPNMYLVGHKSQPTYALGWSTVKPILASGSKNGSIAIWNLERYINATKGFQGGGNQPASKTDFGIKIDKQMSSVGSVRKTRGNPDSAIFQSQNLNI